MKAERSHINTTRTIHRKADRLSIFTGFCDRSSHLKQRIKTQLGDRQGSPCSHGPHIGVHRNTGSEAFDSIVINFVTLALGSEGYLLVRRVAATHTTENEGHVADQTIKSLLAEVMT